MFRTKEKEFLLENQMQYHQKQKQFRNLIMAELLLKETSGKRIYRKIRAFVIRVWDGPKPKHYDDPRIIDSENMKQKPKPFNNNDKSTFPSDRSQRQKMNSWDVILDTTIKSGTPQEKKEMRSYLRDKYNDKDQRKYLSKKELKFISAYNEPKAEPILNTNFKKVRSLYFNHQNKTLK